MQPVVKHQPAGHPPTQLSTHRSSSQRKGKVGIKNLDGNRYAEKSWVQSDIALSQPNDSLQPLSPCFPAPNRVIVRGTIAEPPIPTIPNKNRSKDLEHPLLLQNYPLWSPHLPVFVRQPDQLGPVKYETYYFPLIPIGLPFFRPADFSNSIKHTQAVNQQVISYIASESSITISKGANSSHPCNIANLLNDLEDSQTIERSDPAVPTNASHNLHNTKISTNINDIYEEIVSTKPVQTQHVNGQPIWTAVPSTDNYKHIEETKVPIAECVDEYEESQNTKQCRFVSIFVDQHGTLSTNKVFRKRKEDEEEFLFPQKIHTPDPLTTIDPALFTAVLNTIASVPEPPWGTRGDETKSRS